MKISALMARDCFLSYIYFGLEYTFVLFKIIRALKH